MSSTPYADGRAGIDAALVERLIARQFPQWSDLPVTPVEFDGHDNRTYRLGTKLTVRLPTAEGYVAAVEKENRWLPVLAPSLPVPVPEPVAVGAPGEGYPYPWSVRRWLDGEVARPDRIADMVEFAESIAGFLEALHRVDATDGPVAGAHSFYRGASLKYYDDETRRSLAALEGQIDTAMAAEVWEAALATTWDRPPAWFHGDIASGNLLVRDGRLAAVIDFGTSGVGDPACDLVIAYTMFSGVSEESLEAFRKAVDLDTGTWARARGWALWKAMLVMAGSLGRDPQQTEVNRTVIEAVLADHVAHG